MGRIKMVIMSVRMIPDTTEIYPHYDKEEYSIMRRIKRQEPQPLRLTICNYGRTPSHVNLK